MKKSLQAFIAILSLCTIACHKNDSNKAEEVQVPIEISNARGEGVGGSSGGVTFECKGCITQYPDNTNLPRSGAIFNENEILVATEPGSTTCGITPDFIKVWYSDEHPICLGIRQVVLKEKTGTTYRNFDITPSTTAPSYADNVKVGATDASGDYAGNDVAVDGGRPIFPALFITDITADMSSRQGDWQQKRNNNPVQAITPDKIYGMWKSAIRIIDKTRTPNTVSIQVDPNPSKTNGWNLAGGQAPPPGTPNEKYGALVMWDVKKLIANGTFIKGHIYRIQYMIHDGDQNKSGGDVGQSCTTIYISPFGNNMPD